MAPTPRNPRQQLPREYQNLATTEAVSAIEEKVKNCYSAERYEDFQEAVRKIALNILAHDDGKNVLKPYIEDTTGKYVAAKSLSTKQFWIPTVISVISIITVIALRIWQ